ncbi:hypothetical protein HYC85_001489 [Camellia sinensis]|uniref:F-box domain-containing protein n=1 Tax=Camellia sinensis TaxID=4442 RepID=A0A7J7I5J8_CAMSI|nr:hypothetical protein HYC85_001489 [Camellia sinensis]
MLPEDCVSTILSNTSPLDACRSLSVSSSFHSAANSDIVWERFLPSDYEDIVSRSVTPLKFSSKKRIFVCLCDPILIDGGNKVKIIHTLCKRTFHCIGLSTNVLELEVHVWIKRSKSYGEDSSFKPFMSEWELDVVFQVQNVQIDQKTVQQFWTVL